MTGPLQPGVASRSIVFAERSAGITGSFIDRIMSILPQRGGESRDIISFGDGSPGAEALPADDFRELSHLVFSEPECPALNYGPTEGDAELRQRLLELLAELDTAVPPERLVVTAGGMQGLDLVCKLFVNPGDAVVVELPAFTNALATITSYQGELIGVPVDGDGLIVDRIGEACARLRRPPKLIYANPHFQNPTGATLSLERRHQLLALAADYRAIVLEDDPYTWLGYDGQRLPSLYALSGGAEWVVGVHTFSKIIGPGVRVGWCIGSPEVVAKMVDAKQGMDTCTNMLGQRLIAAYLREGRLQAHLTKLRQLYGGKRDAMCRSLAEAFGDIEGASWTVPEGGFFVWLSLPEPVDTEAMFPRAVEHGVAYVPGRAFNTTDALRSQLRLSFSRADPERIAEGVRRLRTAYDAEPTASGTPDHETQRKEGR